VKGEFEREMEMKKTQTLTNELNFKKKSVDKVKSIESEHWRNDPMTGNSINSSRKKRDGKEYSFV
jgi:hypothetical protein